MSGFARTESGRIVLRVTDIERDALRTLTLQLDTLLAPDETLRGNDPLAQLVGIDISAQRPDDPAMARLLPDAYRDDEAAALDFRRFTERALREQKQAHARTVRDALERSSTKITLSPDEAENWLGFINDTRLVLGERLGVTEHDEIIGPDDPKYAQRALYDWLTYLQETLVQTLLTGSSS